ncbi:MAG TPA: filamentous hemagglutinin N-terminal domain-containing protein, partial [Chroococcidiopsis sp.]
MNRVSAIASLVVVPLVSTIVPGAIALWTLPAAAQIVPDRSLGDESSVLRQNVLRQGRLIDRIEGGATRGSLLFHSFRDFNVGVGDRVYFASPSGIANILSRVTGNSRSEILGRLGVDGSANLYLINPNGIVFGPSATLDIRGSFYASTADQIRLDNGWAFSATNPTAPPLLAVNLTPGLQRGGIATGSSVINQGNLAVGGDLTLAADRLDLYHQLSAGQTLSLYAQDTLRIRDSATQPFIATSGGNMLLQGDRVVDISALSHPGSGLNAGGDLVLRSLTPITGDAHFSAGGSFRIEQLDGSLGDLSSPNDPVIRAGGNVSFTDYTGASLHIFAGGAVNIGSVTITGPDVTNGINETVTLSDGSTVAISGNTQATLDVRAGTRAVGSPAGLTGVPSPTGLNLGSGASSANITIGQITVTPANGLVFLTNQYQPDASLSGGTIRVGSIEVSNPAGSGSVVLDARDGIRLTGAVSAIAATGNGGDIRFLADGDINLEPGFSILSEGVAGGRIQLASGGTLTITGPVEPPPTPDIRTLTIGDGAGGDLSLSAPSIVLNGTAISATLGEGATGQGGDLRIRAGSLFAGFSGVTSENLGSGAGGRLAVNVSGDTTIVGSTLLSVAVGDGDAGAVSFRGRSLTANNGGQLGSVTFGGGDAGDVTIVARDFVAFDGFVPTFQDPDGNIFGGIASGAFSSA